MQSPRDADDKLNFSSLDLPSELIQVAAELGYLEMTTIQAQSIPILLTGRDFVGQSKTGSGKTAAFALPILAKVVPQRRHIQALILCPTRELSSQVARDVRKLGRKLQDLQVLVLSGGQPMAPQSVSLKKGVHIVVGTPGRIVDHINKGNLDFKGVSTVVLDEADRMLDMGFEDEIEIILNKTPKVRQTVFFSATFPPSIEQMSVRYQNDPLQVVIDDKEPNTGAIRQFILETDVDQKTRSLLYLLQKHKPSAAIVFSNFKATVAELEKELLSCGVSTAALHGDLEQYERDRVMARFRNRSIRVLLATDVAARGIDIESIDMVINYDLPAKPEVYVHRIGRTGRAGKSGLAVSFVSSREMDYKLVALEAFLGFSFERLDRIPQERLDVAMDRESLRKSAQMETLYISAGRKNKMRPGDILGALTGPSAGLQGTSVGKIEIHDRFSYVAIEKSEVRKALEALRNGNIKGRKYQIEIVR